MPSSALAGAGYRRIYQGQTLTLHSITDAAVTLRAWARVIYDDGSGQLLTIGETPRTADSTEVLASTDVVVRDGWVVNAEVEMLTAGIARGQTFVRLTVEPFGAALLADYCYSDFGHVSLGTFSQYLGGRVQTLKIAIISSTTRVTAITPATGKRVRVLYVFSMGASATSTENEIYFGTGANIGTAPAKAIGEQTLDLVDLPSQFAYLGESGSVGAVDEVVSVRQSVSVSFSNWIIGFREE